MIRFYLLVDFFCTINILETHICEHIELYAIVVQHGEICVELLFATKQQALETCSNISPPLALKPLLVLNKSRCMKQFLFNCEIAVLLKTEKRSLKRTCGDFQISQMC